MTVSQTLQLSLFVLSAVFVCGNPCYMEELPASYSTMVYYEMLAFPLYGAGEAELNDTCNRIDSAVKIIMNFLKESDEQCQQNVKRVINFFKDTGLRNLTQELCVPHKPLRKKYLENYQCLESNSYEYQACINISQISQEYMGTFPFDDEDVEMRIKCCYLSWYPECFINITMSTCGVSATSFISESLRLLMGHIVYQCKFYDVICHEPPLPNDGNFLNKDYTYVSNRETDFSFPVIKNSTALFSCALACFIAMQCLIVVSKCLL